MHLKNGFFKMFIKKVIYRVSTNFKKKILKFFVEFKILFFLHELPIFYLKFFFSKHK